MSNSVRPHRRQPTRLHRPWDSPGKNTGLGCHFLLQCMKVKSESEVAQSCLTLCDPMDCSLPGSSVHGIFQARVLEWGAIAFSFTCHEAQRSGLRASCLELLAFPEPHGCRLKFPEGAEKAMATHSGTLAWNIPWTEEPGRLQSMGSLRVGHD